MSKLALPLNPLVVSIGYKGEKGPNTARGESSLDLEFGDLGRLDLSRIAPERVMSWLFCPAYDAYDVARFLTKVGFLGTFCAVAHDLPNPAIVAEEIRRCFPALDFCLRSPSEVSERVADYHDFVAQQSAHQHLAPA